MLLQPRIYLCSAVVVMANKDGAKGGLENDALAPSVITIVGDSTLASNSTPKLCTSVVAGNVLCALIRFKNSISLSHGLGSTLSLMYLV